MDSTLYRFVKKIIRMKKEILILLFIVLVENTLAQVGLQFGSGEDLDGYILYQPNNNLTTYLIDGEGYVVAEWESVYQPGRAVYLLYNGNLLKTARIENFNFIDGGRGGRIELISSSNEVLWSYELSNEFESLHHDVAFLPNGNILALAWEKISSDDALENGRKPELIPANGEIWMEKIIELKPSGSSDATIVWEWHLIDHLVQDYDETKSNYGDISSDYRKLDFNYQIDNNGADWIHMNAIDYNEELDQIVVSTPFINEIWIIDHSTTTLEASTGAGGNSGHGGDFLFRWGNNHTYGMSNLKDRDLFGQHNPQWIKENGDWKILLFNNGRGREELYSTIDQVDLSFDNDGLNYSVLDGVFNSNSTNIYTAENKDEFYSSFVSGVQKLANNQYLICEGANGRIFQIDENKRVVWEYVNPIDIEPKCSNSLEETGGIVFRASYIPKDFNGLSDYNINRKYLLETLGCPLKTKKEIVNSVFKIQSLSSDYLEFNFASGINDVAFYTIDGKSIPFSYMGDQNFIAKINGYTGVIIVNCALNDKKIVKKIVLKK